jgi:hypothetical protein
MGNLFSSAPAQPEPTSPGPVFEEQSQPAMGGNKPKPSTRPPPKSGTTPKASPPKAKGGKTRRSKKGKGKGKGRK